MEIRGDGADAVATRDIPSTPGVKSIHVDSLFGSPEAKGKSPDIERLGNSPVLGIPVLGIFVGAELEECS